MPRAAHMFMPPRVREKQVGSVVFGSGAELAIWCGDWDGDGLRELGFVAMIREVPAEDPPQKTTATQPQPGCQQSKGGCKQKGISISLKVCAGICLDISLGGGCK